MTKVTLEVAKEVKVSKSTKKQVVIIPNFGRSCSKLNGGAKVVKMFHNDEAAERDFLMFLDASEVCQNYKRSNMRYPMSYDTVREAYQESKKAKNEGQFVHFLGERVADSLKGNINTSTFLRAVISVCNQVIKPTK